MRAAGLEETQAGRLRRGARARGDGTVAGAAGGEGREDRAEGEGGREAPAAQRRGPGAARTPGTPRMTTRSPGASA